MTASQTDRFLSRTNTLTDNTRGSRLTVFWIAVLVAAVHVVLVAIQPTLSDLLIVEGVVGVTLTANEFRETRSVERALALGLVFAAVGGGLWIALSREVDLWLAAWLLLTGFGLLGYGLYRYQLVVHGSVEATDEY